MVNLYNNKTKVDDNQSIYDAFNNFILSVDRNVFNKLAMRAKLYDMARGLSGDIVECGVFKGSGLFTWLKLIDMYEPNSIKKVIGFDFFGNDFVDKLTDTVDRETMRQVFTRDSNLSEDDISIEGFETRLQRAGFKDSKYDLVKGDITKTSYQYLETRPGLRISILYLDMDLDEPTYCALEAFWDRVVPGGLVVFDEYAYHNWSESNAVDRFFKSKNVKMISTNIHAPTAYIIKE